MRLSTRITTVVAAALLATVGLGVGAAQASTTTVSGNTVVAQLSANEMHMAMTYYQTMCAANIVPPVRGTTPFYFETQECVSGLLHCVTYTPAGHGALITYYSDHTDCTTL